MKNWILCIPLVLAGCSDSGQIKAEDCESICGGQARFELARHECERIENVQDADSCKLAVEAAWEACHSRCEFE